MKSINVYGHYGSWNHGNEAIVRGLSEILRDMKITLYSMNKEKDEEYNLDEVCEIVKERSLKRYSFVNIIGAIQFRLFKKNTIRYRYRFKKLLSDCSKKIFVMEMGDQYCEQSIVCDMYYYLNKEIRKKGGITIALGGSINDNKFISNRVCNDLTRYNFIIARESFTYSNLKHKAITNSVCLPDPAFAMKPKECDVPNIFLTRKVIGIVIGDLGQGNEGKTTYVKEGVEKLIEYIIEKTEYAILLIPHVNVNDKLTDVNIEKEILNKYSSINRIDMLSEKRADELKYIISNCRILVTLRTHASIAGYSSGVPTLVLGYSIKSRGIAKDIFGEYEKYVVNINEENIGNSLISRFNYLDSNYEYIKEKLGESIKEYQDKTYLIAKYITEEVNNEVDI